MKSTIKYLLSFSFFSILLFPWINGYFELIKDIDNSENRQLSELPEFDAGHLDPYPEDFETYYNDHFNLRNTLIKLRNTFNYKLFNETQPSSKVLKGNNGWLFFKVNALEDYRNEKTISDSLLEMVKNDLLQRSNWCRKHGMEMFTVFIPKKYVIYSDMLPMNYVKVNPKSNLEKLMEKAEGEKGLNFIDLTDALMKGRENQSVYHKHDMHWNDYGAFVAYQEIMKQIGKKVNITAPILTIDSFEIEYKINHKRDYLEALSIFDEPEERQAFFVPKFKSKVYDGEKSGYPKLYDFSFNNDIEIIKENPAVEGPKAFIIRDSFTYNLTPFLAENFSHITFLWDGWRYKFHKEKLQKEKPDVVIIILQDVGIKALAGLEGDWQIIEE